MYSENYQLLKIYACTLGTRTKTTLNLKCRPLGMKKAVLEQRENKRSCHDISESEPARLLLSSSRLLHGPDFLFIGLKQQVKYKSHAYKTALII